MGDTPTTSRDGPGENDDDDLACPDCGYDLDTPENNRALETDPDHDYFCPTCGELFTEGEV